MVWIFAYQYFHWPWLIDCLLCKFILEKLNNPVWLAVPGTTLTNTRRGGWAGWRPGAGTCWAGWSCSCSAWRSGTAPARPLPGVWSSPPVRAPPACRPGGGSSPCRRTCHRTVCCSPSCRRTGRGPTVRPHSSACPGRRGSGPSRGTSWGSEAPGGRPRGRRRRPEHGDCQHLTSPPPHSYLVIVPLPVWVISAVNLVLVSSLSHDGTVRAHPEHKHFNKQNWTGPGRSHQSAGHQS